MWGSKADLGTKRQNSISSDKRQLHFKLRRRRTPTRTERFLPKRKCTRKTRNVDDYQHGCNVCNPAEAASEQGRQERFTSRCPRRGGAVLQPGSKKSVLPHGGVRSIPQESTRLTRLISGTNAAQIWSRYGRNFDRNETLVLYRVI